MQVLFQLPLPNNKSASPVGKVVFIVCMFIAINALMLGLLYVSGSISEGVRSYVRGEGLWAKAQKDALYHLNTFTYTRDPKDYARFRDDIAVILGDRKARLALSQAEPDLAEAREGFLEGSNHPQDVGYMIDFYLYFHDFPYMHEAIRVWQDGDAKIDELIALSETIKLSFQNGDVSPESLSGMRARLENLNNELFALEERFSTVLGEGARWVRTVALSASAAIIALFIVIGVFVSRKIIAGISRDIAEKEAMEEQIRRQARQDPLTGLNNRTDFFEKFSKHLKLAQREDKLLALLYLDLDRFKPVNDSYGHPVGDTLLQAVAAILATRTRETDIIARIGGDEFVILLVHPNDRHVIGTTAQRIIDGIKAPQNILGHDIRIGASIGISVYPDDDASGENLLALADTALYQAKRDGRGGYCFYTKDMKQMGR